LEVFMLAFFVIVVVVFDEVALVRAIMTQTSQRCRYYFGDIIVLLNEYMVMYIWSKSSFPFLIIGDQSLKNEPRLTMSDKRKSAPPTTLWPITHKMTKLQESHR